jgi:hypothetical protein
MTTNFNQSGNSEWRDFGNLLQREEKTAVDCDFEKHDMWPVTVSRLSSCPSPRGITTVGAFSLATAISKIV